MSTVLDEKFDSEWLELMIQAKQIGLSVEEVRKYLLGRLEQNKIGNAKILSRV
ncbi:anti-repressor SinI family protein [Fredinandcohnia quinoae]|uniref:Anti-repressor SinI family protein n=1 Tax=Fredinandcohnia quinoae TaxID=2918902 RepID=A0AAW5DVC2_9BACI|nr:anti-repressor SinI family protein [Fredinandcohnia sp. SECRCQ15]MCH1624587.1 anti-repressor SinI family protein [Fredinandcohnia sp. SECRCQ15]